MTNQSRDLEAIASKTSNRVRPEAWNPRETGFDTIAGEVKVRETRDIDNNDYDEYPYLELEAVQKDSETGESTPADVFGVHAFHTVLKEQIAEKSPKEGDLIGIKWLGKIDSPDSEGYHDYILEIHQRSEQEDVFGNQESELRAETEEEQEETTVNA